MALDALKKEKKSKKRSKEERLVGDAPCPTEKVKKEKKSKKSTDRENVDDEPLVTSAEKKKKKKKRDAHRSDSPETEDKSTPSPITGAVDSPDLRLLRTGADEEKLYRILLRKAGHESPTTSTADDSRQKFFTTFALSCTVALRKPVLDLLQKWWGDDDSNPYLAETYHSDAAHVTATVSSWEQMRKHGGQLDVPSEICAFHNGSSSCSPIPTLEEELETPKRCLLRVTDATGAGVQDSKSALYRALQDLLRADDAYLRLLKLQWPYCHKSGIASTEGSENMDLRSACEAHVDGFARIKEELVNAGKKSFKPFTFCELFAGLGGFRIGLEAVKKNRPK